MAQDILITPGSGEPQILFRGSGTNDTPIELNVLSSYLSANGSGTALLFEGTEGQLFAITDNLSSGVIFSVADIAGLPLIEADASGDVQLIEYGRYVGVGTGTPAYQLDVFGTGRFSDGIIFPDGNTQTVAYTGQTGDWKVGVSGLTDTITSGETVTFTGLGNTTVTYDASTNTVSVSGSGGGGGGTTYTAGSGLVLDGDEFNIYGGTGDFDEIQFSSTPRIIALKDPLTAPLTPTFLAGHAVTGATDSVVIGHNINAANLGTQMVIIGSDLLADCSPDMQTSVVIGDEAVSNLSALGIVAIGYRAGRSLDPDFGTNADRAVFIGYQCGNNISGDGSDDFDNVVGIGGFAFSDATNVKEAVAIGYFAGHDCLGEDTTFIGYFAGYEQQGDFNFSVGSNAGRACVGSYNLSLGFNANRSTVGSNNIEFVTQGSIPSVIGTNSNKINIENTIIGDTSSKLLAIGNVGSANLTPDATLEILPNASTDIPLIVHGAASQTANLQEWQDSAGNTYSRVTNSGYFSNPTDVGSEAFGDCDQAAIGTNSIFILDSGSTNAGSQSQGVFIGSEMNLAGSDFTNVLIGYNATIQAGSSACVGVGADLTIGANDDHCVVVGDSASTTGPNATVIGQGSSAALDAVVIGYRGDASNGEIVIIGNQATGIYVDSEGSLTIRATGIFQSGLTVSNYTFPTGDGTNKKESY
jgi:hypothetical protein